MFLCSWQLRCHPWEKKGRHAGFHEQTTTRLRPQNTDYHYTISIYLPYGKQLSLLSLHYPRLLFNQSPLNVLWTLRNLSYAPSHPFRGVAPMALAVRTRVLKDMESDPEQPSPSLNRYMARQSRLWMPGSTEAMNTQHADRRLSTARRASKSTRTSTLVPELEKTAVKIRPALGQISTLRELQ